MGRSAEGWKLLWRNGIGYARFRHAKARYCLSTGKSDPREAAQEAARLYARVVGGKPRERQRVLSVADPIDRLGARWLLSLEGVLDPKTVETYELYMRKHFLPFFEDVGQLTHDGKLSEFSRARLRVVLRKTVRKELSALKGWLGWLLDEGIIGELPKWPTLPQKATGKRSGKQRAKANELSPDQVEAFLAALPELSERCSGGLKFWIRPRFILAYETGLRPATLDTLTWGHRRGRWLTIDDEHDKSRFGRQVPLSERASAALDEMHHVLDCMTGGEFDESELIFGRHDYRAAIRKAASAAGIDLKVAPYDFRHARGTHMVDDGNTLGAVAYMLGHTQVTTTAKYAKPTRRAAEIAMGLPDSGSVRDQKEPEAGAKEGNRTPTRVTPLEPEPIEVRTRQGKQATSEEALVQGASRNVLESLYSGSGSRNASQPEAAQALAHYQWLEWAPTLTGGES